MKPQGHKIHNFGSIAYNCVQYIIVYL